MCGIAGIYSLEKHPSFSDIKIMTNTIYHRGPDSKGIYVEGPIALGMRRLSIIDLESGDQPIWNKDKTVCVIFNGEIYNYIELRSELKSKKYSFSTNSDTEVLVYLYEEYGIRFLDKLNGMFCFAIWDTIKQKLFISRDRLGIKPLYYHYSNNSFIFASEIKSILQLPFISNSINNNSLAELFFLGYYANEKTPFKNIKKLLPSHYLSLGESGLSIHNWYNIKNNIDKKVSDNPKNLRDELNFLFEDSVSLRMRSDVPVATFLSGGLDSSLITASATKKSTLPINTYSIGYDGIEAGELSYAKKLSKFCNTNYNEIIIGPNDLLELLPMILWHLDTPMFDLTILPQYVVSMMAAKDVKVCLSGVGGDELFGGYDRYYSRRYTAQSIYRKIFNKIPNVAGLIHPIVERFSARIGNELLIAKNESYLWKKFYKEVVLFTNNEISQLGLIIDNDFENSIEKYWQSFNGNDYTAQAQFVDQNTYLPHLLLDFTDKMSMAASLEVRVPFLDHRLVEFAYKIPGSHKQSSYIDSKIFLKSVLGYTIPTEIMNRSKRGFSPPINEWLNNPKIKKLVLQLPEKLSGYIDPIYLNRLINNKNNTKRNNSQIWMLLIFYIWLQVYSLDKKPTYGIEEFIN